MASGIGRFGTAFGDDSRAGAFITDLSTIPFSMTVSEPSPSSSTLPATLPMKLGSAPSFPETSIRFDGDLDPGLNELIALVRSWSPEAREMRALLHFPEGETVEYQFDGVESETGTMIDLIFDDQSAVTIQEARPNGGGGDLPLDHPSRLAEPITVDEYGVLEVLIGKLTELVDEAEPDEDLRLRIEGAIGVLQGTYRAVEVGKTPRREIVPVVRRVLAYVRTGLPRDIMAWRGVFETLADVYPSVVDFLNSL